LANLLPVSSEEGSTDRAFKIYIYIQIVPFQKRTIFGSLLSGVEGTAERAFNVFARTQV
jgi:hypothetical protein